MNKRFVTIILIFIFLAGCAGRGDSIIRGEKSAVEKSDEYAEMELLANCLEEFIRNNTEDPLLQYYEIDLNEESVNRGPNIRSREDLWIIGQWTCEKFDSYPEPDQEPIDEGEGYKLYKSNTWWLGKWTGQTDDWYFVAWWGFESVAGEGTSVKVRIEKSQDGGYAVTDWTVVKYLVDRD